jgi:hypothetical protein
VTLGKPVPKIIAQISFIQVKILQKKVTHEKMAIFWDCWHATSASNLSTQASTTSFLRGEIHYQQHLSVLIFAQSIEFPVQDPTWIGCLKRRCDSRVLARTWIVIHINIKDQSSIIEIYLSFQPSAGGLENPPCHHIDLFSSLKLITNSS